MSLDKYGEYEITVKNSHMEKRADGSWVRIEDPETTHTVELKMDSEKIMHSLAERAAHNRSGRAAYMHGCIVVTVIKTKGA